MQFFRSSYPELQFIFLQIAVSVKDIKKTIIFVESFSDIWPMIEIFQV